MSSVVHLPDDLAARISAEAERRDLSVDELSAELLEAALASEEPADPLRAFIGSGRSGRSDLGRRHREIRAELTKDRSASSQ
ncbi:MAG TPA: hypothetical protein VMD59_23015 [Acidimicrobiales bacterium]|nr:hypothetical protein [Acidimicrobiales bacterium]